MPKVYISERVCAKALNKMVELLDATDTKDALHQHRAADSIMRACQTQQRYGLKPQSEHDFKNHATIHGSAAKALEDMTPDELLELQREMLGDEYPGKPS